MQKTIIYIIAIMLLVGCSGTKKNDKEQEIPEQLSLNRTRNESIAEKESLESDFYDITYICRGHRQTDDYGITNPSDLVYLHFNNTSKNMLVNIYTNSIYIMKLSIEKPDGETKAINVLKGNHIYFNTKNDNRTIVNIEFVNNSKHYVGSWASFDELEIADGIKIPEGPPIIDNIEFQTDLIKQIRTNTLPLQELINKEAKIPDFYRLYPIHYAIKAKLKELYERNLLVEKNDIDIDPPIHLALENKDYDAIDFLLKNGEDPFGKDTIQYDNPGPEFLHIIIALNDPVATELYIKHISKDQKNNVFRQAIIIRNNSIDASREYYSLVETSILGYAVLVGNERTIAFLKANGFSDNGEIKIYKNEDYQDINEIYNISNYTK